MLRVEQKEGAAPCVPVELLFVLPESSCSIVHYARLPHFSIVQTAEMPFAYSNMADLFTFMPL